MKLNDLSGKRFGHLVVIKRVEEKGYPVFWLCKCDCGNTKAIAGKHLLDGSTSSCGCMHYKYGHGKTETRLYHIWRTMKARCFDKNSCKYSRYGGRGITMSEEWKNSFMAFHDWAVSNGYNEELSIDRMDNNKGYFPDNCRWATAEEQANNTSTNVIINHKGATGTLSQMARNYGLKPSVVSKRIKRGWSVQRALETPLITKFSMKRSSGL